LFNFIYKKLKQKWIWYKKRTGKLRYIRQNDYKKNRKNKSIKIINTIMFLNNEMIKNIHKYLAICGIIAPLLFAFKVLIIGFYHPNYNHITQYMSELGAINAPYAIINNTGLAIGGILITLFSYGFLKELNEKKSILIQIGFSLVFISGLSFFLIGFSPCDPDCINFSTIGIIHSYLSNTAQLPLIIAPLFLICTFKGIKKWNSVYVFSFLTVLFGIAFFLIYKYYLLEDYTGLLQRISFGIPLLWIEIMGIKTYKLKLSKS